MRRALPLLLLLLLLAALLVVALLARRGEMAPPAAPDETPARSADPGAAAPAPAVAAASAARVSGFLRRDAGPRAARIRVWTIPAETRYGENELLAPVPEGDPVVEAASDADGRFGLGDLPAGNYRLIAETDDGAFGTIDFALRPPLGRETVSVRVRGGGPCGLRGVAVREDGTPFRGFLLAGPERRPAATDGDGRFVFAGLPAGLVPLAAVEPGRRSVDAGAARVPADEEVRLVIGSGDRVYSGTVVADADGAPIEGVAVEVAVQRLLGLGDDTVRTRTAVDGAFSVRVAPGDQHVRLSKAGWRTFEANPETDDPLVWRLERAGGVAGRVVAAADGRPLAGVPVHAVPWHDGSVGFGTDRSTVTDADGRFAFDDFRAAVVLLWARGAGWCSRELAGDFPGGPLALVRELPEGGAVDVVLVAVPAFRLRGRVTDAAGAAAGGATVRAFRDFEGPSLFAAAVTDSEGRFALELVPARVQEVRVGSDWGPEELSGASGEEREIEIRLRAERWVDLEVVRAGASGPVAGADVTVFARPGEAWRTGPDGRARLAPLPRGEIELRVECAGLRLARPILLPADTTGVTVRAEMIAWDGPSGVLSGRVVVPGNLPIRDGKVEAAHRSSPVATDGRFELRGVPEGDLDVVAVVSAGGKFWLGDTRGRVAGPDVALHVREWTYPDRTVRVRVLDPEGRPVPRADLEAQYFDADEEGEWSCGGERARVTCGEASLFPSAQARRVSLLVCHAKTGSERPLAAGPVRHGPVGLPAEEIVVRLPRDRPIAGRVVGEDGRGLPGILVRAQHVDEWLLDSQAVSGPDGGFRLLGIGEGDYRLNANTPSGRNFGCGEEPVVPAGTEGVELRMEELAPRVPVPAPAPPAVCGVVRDAEGRPVSGARIWVRESGSWDRQRRSFYDGTFRGWCRGNGPVDVLALPPGEGPETWVGEIARVEPGATDVVLPYRPGSAIFLTVDGWSGGRQEARVAVFRAGDAAPRRVPIDEDGRVRLAGLAADESVDVGCPPLSDGRAFYVPGVAGRSGPVRASLVACPLIRVRPLLPPGGRIHHVHALGFGTILSGAAVDGGVDVRVTPGRAWTVVVGAMIDGRVVERRVEARGGETIRPDFTR